MITAPTPRISRVMAQPEARLAVIMVLVFALMAVLAPERFLSAQNATSMAFQFPEFAILALAMTITMLTGGIDLSVVGVANCASIVSALILTRLAPGADAGMGWLLLAYAAALVGGAIAFVLRAEPITEVRAPAPQGDNREDQRKGHRDPLPECDTRRQQLGSHPAQQGRRGGVESPVEQVHGDRRREEQHEQPGSRIADRPVPERGVCRGKRADNRRDEPGGDAKSGKRDGE